MSEQNLKQRIPLYKEGDQVTNELRPGVSIPLTAEQQRIALEITEKARANGRQIQKLGDQARRLHEQMWGNIHAWYPGSEEFSCRYDVENGIILVGEKDDDGGAFVEMVQIAGGTPDEAFAKLREAIHSKLKNLGFTPQEE